jgi:hypothetical protein
VSGFELLYPDAPEPAQVTTQVESELLAEKVAVYVRIARRAQRAEAELEAARRAATADPTVHAARLARARETARLRRWELAVQRDALGLRHVSCRDAITGCAPLG